MIHPFAFQFSFTRTPGGHIHLRSDLAPASKLFLGYPGHSSILGTYPLTLYHCSQTSYGLDALFLFFSIHIFRNVYYRRYGSATHFWGFFCLSLAPIGTRSWEWFHGIYTTAMMLYRGKEGKGGHTFFSGSSCRCGTFIRMGCWNLGTRSLLMRF
jgi:hypothetical protein